MNNPLKVLTSKKFLAAVVAILFAFFGDRAGIDQQVVTEAVYALIAYIIGQGLADFGKEAK